VAKLIVNPTSVNRREIPLARATILTIGRDPSNDLVLPDAMVSRRHAVVEHRGTQFFLRDCSSANGSVVNGDRVSERGLRDGDLVAIGSMRLLFREEPVESGGTGKVLQHPSAAPLACPSCGGSYRRGDLFCRECGAQVAEPSGPPRTVCASCGSAVPLPARFCNACGTALATDGQRVEEPPAGEPARPDVPLRTAALPAARPSGSLAVAPERRAAAAGAVTEPSPELAPAARAMRSRERPAPAPSRGPAPPAEFASRLAAFLVDSVFVASGQAVLLAPVGWYWWAREAPRTPADVPFGPILASAALLPIALLLGALYHVYFWSVKGATPGKELLDLRVETEDGTTPVPLGRATLRVFGYLLGVASLGVGFLMAAFGGVALHDWIAGTRVVRGWRR
jgi:uncharacterized RDD family membrane protein YckC